MEIDLKTVIFVQLLFELTASIVCLISNFYFASKFSRLRTFHPSFRRVLITLHIVMSMTMIFHPILLLIPPDYYSVAKGRYHSASIFYCFMFIGNLLAILTTFKYLLIGWERRIGFKYRTHYEHRGTSTANWILFSGLLLTLIVTVLKCVLSFIFTVDMPIDDRLQFTFNIDQNEYAILTLLVISGAAYDFALYEFWRLNKYVKDHYYTANSLAESFTIKQTSTIVNVLRPILIAFAWSLVFFVVLQSAFVYFHFFRFFPMNSPLVTAILLSIYSIFMGYSIYATMIMIWEFKRVRKELIRDLRRLFGCEIVTQQVACTVSINNVVAREDHFRQLAEAWNK
ncbi:hypothetical protein M3Y96_00390300 [Aphelenchoides besseyi]|nr:hypothetical protein M3Y96_00390300 [Aphelenchoides besseyi]